jgi:hypothetical protein
VVIFSYEYVEMNSGNLTVNTGGENANVVYAASIPTSMQVPSLEKATRGRVAKVGPLYNRLDVATRSRSPSPPAHQTAAMLPAPEVSRLLPFVNMVSPQKVTERIVNPLTLTRGVGTRTLSISARRRRALRRTHRTRRNSRR